MRYCVFALIVGGALRGKKEGGMSRRQGGSERSRRLWGEGVNTSPKAMIGRCGSRGTRPTRTTARRMSCEGTRLSDDEAARWKGGS